MDTNENTPQQATPNAHVARSSEATSARALPAPRNPRRHPAKRARRVATALSGTAVVVMMGGMAYGAQSAATTTSAASTVSSSDTSSTANSSTATSTDTSSTHTSSSATAATAATPTTTAVTTTHSS